MSVSGQSKPFILPDLGEGLTEAEIVNWLVAVGDTVVVDQPVVEVESAKSTVELPCPFAGVIESLNASVGDTVHAGETLLTVAVEVAADAGGPDAGATGAGVTGADVTGAGVADAGATGAGATGAGVSGTPDAGADVVPGTAIRAESDASDSSASGAVLVGYGTRARTSAARRVPSGRFGRRATAAAVTPGGVPAVDVATAPRDMPARVGASPVVSPLVRRLARDHGFDASMLAGSGPDALVMRADVEAHIARMRVAAPAGVETADGDVRIPLTGIRKLIAERMSASRREVPEATIWLDVDATGLLDAKRQLESATGERWSVTALIARFVVAGLAKHPILNSSVDAAAGEIVQHAEINLGLAAQTSRGLMVPVVHGAGRMTSRQLRDAVSGVVEAAAGGGFTPEQLRGGTFTLNNYGGFGVDGSAPIINQPEVAMLGVGRMIERPWVVDGELAVRTVMTLSMVFDHRVCDGDVPSEFITFIARCIESPIALLDAL